MVNADDDRDHAENDDDDGDDYKKHKVCLYYRFATAPTTPLTSTLASLFHFTQAKTSDSSSSSIIIITSDRDIIKSSGKNQMFA